MNSESMRHVGMNRNAMKEAVLQKLGLGQQYRLKSIHATPNDNPVDARCKLVEISENVAVFKHKNGYTESFTYQELWIQMMSGTFV